MNSRERQKITTNEQYLCDNVKVNDITPHLIQNSVLSLEDEQRIGFFSTDGEKVHKLLRILEEHEKGFEYFCKALREEHMEHAADALECTPIDEKAIETEQHWSDKTICDILRRNFCIEINEHVYLGSIIEDIRFEFRQNGYAYHIHEDHISRLITNIFPTVSKFRNPKKKELVFRNLRRKASIKDHTDDTDKNPENKQNEDKDTQDRGFDISVSNNERKRAIEELSSEELVQLLLPRFEAYNIPKETSQQLIKGEISGRNFKRLKMKYMQDIFPSFSFNNKLSLLNLRDDIIEEEAKASKKMDDDVSTPLTHSPVTTHLNSNFKEMFRKFDKAARATDCYRQGAILSTNNTRPSNLLEPVHFFSKLTMQEDTSLYSTMSDEIAEFAAACINERSNGTIHFGILPQQGEFRLDGIVQGLQIDRENCLRNIYRKLEDRFFKDEISLLFKCIRPPQFIEVSSQTKKGSRNYVLEIDIIPDSSLLREEAFFIKGKIDRNPILFLFTESGISPKHLTEDQARIFMSKTKNLISDCRRNQEKRPPLQYIKPDLRQKMLDCLSSGEERMSADIYPLLFLSPLVISHEDKTSMDNFEFLADLDASAIFDFDYSKENDGLYRYMVTEKCQVFTALTTDNFDPYSEENQRLRETHTNLLEYMKQSHIKSWIFCNGYDPLSKPSMPRKDWKQNRMKGFKEVIRFYCSEIPTDRALVIFFLFSKNYDIMLEAAEEVILNFKDQWVVIAESAEIANHWCYELERRETVDKKDIEKRVILGMPWNHVNQTIHQLSSAKRPIRCEIPTSTGAFCHLKEKDKTKLHDLEIVSRNECDDPEITNDAARLSTIRRNVAETFYRGGAVSWWNFWFPDHVLKREIHKKLKTKIKEALAGIRTEEDNKIGLVNIYHQPGAGGTTTAMHVLWELRTKYRCCIVKQLTDQTVDQITDLRTYEDKDDPKPPLVLIDNGDEEKVGDLFAVLQNKAKIAARRGNNEMKIFCVLLLCIRRTVITSKDETSVALRHDLLPQELEWFRTRHATLEKQFKDKKGPDPKFLISFNILKENFNKQYIQRTAKELVKGVLNTDERRLLKYLSLLNTFDLESQPVPISAFDPIMTSFGKRNSYIFGLASDCGRRRKTDWENSMSQPLQVLLNQSCRAGLGKQLVGLSIINPLFAKEIFSCFITSADTTSSIVIEFLNSEIFMSSNMSSMEVMKVVKNIMKKREEKEDSIKVKFSPLIMKLLQEESDASATDVLVKVYDMTKDPMICQHIARLYIHFQNWDRATEYAQIATEIKPLNSYLWDTLGQVYTKRLLSKYIAISQQGRDLSDEEIEEAIEITKLGIANFKKEQEVSEAEHSNKLNDAGYYGELRMIILLLDMLRFCKLGRQKKPLHKYLTDKDFIPEEMSKLKVESIEFLKSLEAQSEMTIQTIEEKVTQLKDDMYYSIFGKEILAKNAIASLRENLNNYFGEESDEIPASLSDSDRASYRRRRVKRIGGRSLFNFLRIEAEENLPIALNMLFENARSEYWEIFDIINLINVVIAMKIKKIHQNKLEYDDLVHFSRKCYERAIMSNDKRSYLEVFMYFVLFNWPTDARKKHTVYSVDQLRDATKRWKSAFYDNHPRQKETKPIRKRETTIFFLGKGTDMNAIVHYEELHDPGIKGDRVWETEDFIRKLLRLQGTLIDGTEVSCNVETASGGIPQFVLPTAVYITNRALWQKRVCFVLGFSWAGIKAFDIREEMPEVNKLDNASSVDQFNSSQQPNVIIKPKPIDRIKTHDQFMSTFVRLRKLMEKVDKDITSEDTKEKDRQALCDKRKELQGELSKLIKAREDFFSN